MDNQRKIILAFKIISKAAGILSMLVGFAVLFGWALDIPVLKSLSPDFVTMKANTAIAFFISGAALLLVQENNIKIWRRRLSIFLALIVLLIGLLSFYENVFNINLGIDQLFFQEGPGAVLTSSPGRMAPTTAFNFIFLGVALLGLNFPRWHKISQYLCLPVFLSALMGLVGYMYGIHQFVGVFPWLTRMALHTAFMFLFLTTGIILTHLKVAPIELLSGDDSGGFITRLLVPFEVIALFLLGYFQVLWYERYMGAMSLEDAFNRFKFHIGFLVISIIVVFTVIIWHVAILSRRLDLARRTIENKMKVEKNQINTISQSVSAAIIAIDRNWNIILWNKGAEKLIGWAGDEVIGRQFSSIIKLIRERDREVDVRFIEDAMITAQPGVLQESALLLKQNGEEVVVSNSAAPIIDEAGEVTGAIIIMRDMTHERERAAISSDFTYASHQLRTPITRALYLLEASKDEADLSKVRDGIAVAYKSLESIRRLSEELVMASELDQGLIIPKIKSIKLVNLINEAITSVSEKTPDSAGRIILPKISSVVTVNSDQKILKKILAEVLDNAIIYSSKKTKIEIEVDIRNDGTVIEVKNRGIGVTLEHQPLVFVKFFRGSNFNTVKIPGAGLGLFIAKEYLKLLNGKIWFKSIENGETTFYIYIPK